MTHTQKKKPSITEENSCSQRKIRSRQHCLKLVAGSATCEQSEALWICAVLCLVSEDLSLLIQISFTKQPQQLFFFFFLRYQTLNWRKLALLFVSGSKNVRKVTNPLACRWKKSVFSSGNKPQSSSFKTTQTNHPQARTGNPERGGKGLSLVSSHNQLTYGR